MFEKNQIGKESDNPTDRTRQRRVGVCRRGNITALIDSQNKCQSWIEPRTLFCKKKKKSRIRIANNTTK